MDTPQEVQVWYILPAIRRELVLNLKLLGLKQKDIALLLNITEPAVSQYLKNKRGSDIRFSKKIKDEIKKSSKKIIENKKLFRTELQKLIRLVKDTRFLCTVCNEHTGTNEDCEICYG